MIRIVYQRGEFNAAETDLVATALFWFALSLPTNGMFLLLSRTFFGLQQPWIPTWIALGNLAGDRDRSFLLYKPYGVAGIVAATAIATTISVAAQAIILRRRLGGIEATALLNTTIRVAIGSLVLAFVSYEVWDLLDASSRSGPARPDRLDGGRPRPGRPRLRGGLPDSQGGRAGPDRRRGRRRSMSFGTTWSAVSGWRWEPLPSSTSACACAGCWCRAGAVRLPGPAIRVCATVTAAMVPPELLGSFGL